MNYDDPQNQGFHGIGNTIDPAKRKILEQMKEEKERDRAEKLVEHTDEKMRRIEERLSEVQNNQLDALAGGAVRVKSTVETKERIEDSEEHLTAGEILEQIEDPKEDPKEPDTTAPVAPIVEEALSSVVDLPPDPPVDIAVDSPPDELIIEKKDLLGSSIAQSVQEGMSEMAAEDAERESQKPIARERELPPLRGEKEFRTTVIEHTRELISKMRGEIPTLSMVRSSILAPLTGGGGATVRSFNERERSLVEKVYNELAANGFADVKSDIDSENNGEEQLAALAPSVPAQIVQETAPSTPPVTNKNGVDDWDVNFPSVTPVPFGSSVADAPRVGTSWTPVRKGVVGRAAGSEERDAVKNPQTGQWEFSEGFIEEKRKETEQDLNNRDFEEKKRPALTALFKEEADKLGKEEFDASYLLAMMKDRRGGVPLDEKEIALFRTLYAERYGQAASVASGEAVVPSGAVLETADVQENKEEVQVDAGTEGEVENVDDELRVLFDGGVEEDDDSEENFDMPVFGMSSEEIENIESGLYGDALGKPEEKVSEETAEELEEPQATEVGPVVAVRSETMTVAKESEERKKLNSILTLLHPEADPADVRNDARTMAFVMQAFHAGQEGGAALPALLAHACATAEERVQEPGGGIGTMKAKWVEEAFSLGKAIHDRGGEELPVLVHTAPTEEVTPTPLETPPAVATSGSEPNPPNPSVENGELPEATKRVLEEFYQELSIAEREQISAGMLNWGYSLKRWTGDKLSGAISGDMRNKNQLLDTFARRWEKRSQEAELKLREAKEEKKAGGAVGLGGKIRKAQRIAGSAGFITGAAARIGRPVASALGLMPLGKVMLASMLVAETAGMVKDYNEQTVANTVRDDEDYRKREGETDAEYIARTQNGTALDEAWEMYTKAQQKAEQVTPGMSPNRDQIQTEYVKSLPKELLARLDRVPEEDRNKWFQGWMRDRIKEKIKKIEWSIAGGENEKEVDKIANKRKNKRLLDRYARLVEETGTIHSFALAAVQTEKINKAAVTVFSVDTWGRAAAGMYRLAAGFLAGDAHLSVPEVGGARVNPTERLRLTYDDFNTWLAGRPDRGKALEMLRARLETGNLDSQQKEAINLVLKENPAPAVVPVTAPKSEVTSKVLETEAITGKTVSVESTKAIPENADKGQTPEPVAKRQMREIDGNKRATNRSPEQTVPEAGRGNGMQTIEVVRHVNNMPVESVISDYIAHNPDAAKKLGWNGKDDLIDFSKARAHGLWFTYAGDLLRENSAQAVALQHDLRAAGVSVDPAGYAEYIRRNPQNGIRIDLLGKKVSVVGPEYFAQDAATHGGAHTAVVEEAEERLQQGRSTETKAGLDQALLAKQKQFFDRISHGNQENSAIRAHELIEAVRSGDADAEAFVQYFGREMGGTNGADSIRGVFRDAMKGTPEQQVRAENSLKGLLDNLSSSREPLVQEFPAAGVQRMTIDKIVYSGGEDARMRAHALGEAIRAGKVDPNVFAQYFAQQMRTSENSQAVVGLRRTLEDLRGTPQQQASAKLSLTINMQNMTTMNPTGSVGVEGVRVEQPQAFRPPTGGRESFPERRPLENLVYAGRESAVVRARDLGSAVRSGRLSSDTFAKFYAQEMKIPEDSADVFALRKLLEDVRGPYLQRASAEAALASKLQNLQLINQNRFRR